MAPPPRHQQTSVVLGYDRIGYESSAVALSAGHARNQPNQDAVVSTKANANRECHVVFGEPGTKRDFTKASTQLDPTGEMHKYAAHLNEDERKMLQKTSSIYGTDIVRYVTSTQDATSWSRAAADESAAIRNEIRKRTGPRPTRGMSFDDEVVYVSEAKSAFENKFGEFKPTVMAATVKNDLRATHFMVGHEKLDYRTSSHIDRLSPKAFAEHATRPPPLHDLRKSTVEIT